MDERKLIFIREQRYGGGLEVPARNPWLAGLPEYRGRKNASRQRHEPIGNAIQRGDRCVNDTYHGRFGARCDREYVGHDGLDSFGSGRTISCTRPELMSPARLPVRSKSGSSASAASAAAPSGWPAASASRNAAPPGGSARTCTSRCGRQMSASSLRQSPMGASSCSPLFIAQIVTIGYGERTTPVEGCTSMRISPIAVLSSFAKRSAPLDAASAA